MLIFEICLLIFTILSALVGGWCIYSAKADPESNRARWGRLLFVVVLLSIGSAALIAAFLHSAGLPPLGLVAGLLVVGMLWDGEPQTASLDETGNAY